MSRGNPHVAVAWVALTITSWMAGDLMEGDAMHAMVQSYAAEIKVLIGRTAHNIIAIGEKLQAVKAHLGHGHWEAWLRTEFDWSQSMAVRMIQVAERFKSVNLTDLRFDLSALYVLAAPSTPPAATAEAVTLAQHGAVISPTTAKALVNKHRGTQTLARHTAASVVSSHEGTGLPLVLVPDALPVGNGYRPTFNQTNEMVDWAKWTWNPVTGCLHNCTYCYARDIAERFYPEKFAPTFRPERLKAPQYTKVPPEAETQMGYRNVFVCSMADLFGKWVPQEWIDAVLDEVRAAPQWNFLFLTKFPQRLADIRWPGNAWVGTTVDEQYRVEIAEKAFRKVDAPVRWLSCEPLRERLTFRSLEMFDWVILGGQSKSSQAPAFQPPWEWVWHLCQQVDAAGCLLYWKPNLLTRPQEWPGGVGPA